ncbi:hypothetical protein [Caulobacter sp. LARHSG274]
MSSKRNEAAAAAARQPPTCLAGFSTSLLPPHHEVSVDYEVRCKTCGDEHFHISGFPIVAPDPSPYFAIAPGETIWRPAHSLRCAHCGAGGRVFDARTSGYDGVLNGGCSYESGETDEQDVEGLFKITIALAYNVELSELLEAAQEAEVGIADLFDSFTISGEPVNGGRSIELDYECA